MNTNTQEVYILQKDLPYVKAGAKYKSDGFNYTCSDGQFTKGTFDTLAAHAVENNPEWFKKEEPKQSGMSIQKGLHHGVYKIYWVSGGESFASIGSTYDGTNWFAPCNCTSESNDKPMVASTKWEDVKSIELIKDYFYGKREEIEVQFPKESPLPTIPSPNFQAYFDNLLDEARREWKDMAEMLYRVCKSTYGKDFNEWVESKKYLKLKSK